MKNPFNCLLYISDDKGINGNYEKMIHNIGPERGHFSKSVDLKHEKKYLWTLGWMFMLKVYF